MNDNKLCEAMEKILKKAGVPLRAQEIAKRLQIDRSQANAVLHRYMGVKYQKNYRDFTWRLATVGSKPLDEREPRQEREIDVHFAPDGNPIRKICQLIDDAEHLILIQAYYFRSENIAEALIRARARRKKVTVKALLGHTSNRSGMSRDTTRRHGGDKAPIVKRLHCSGIEILEDYGTTNNHNKCIVIDGSIAITGGMNFCEYAEENADNIVVIRNKAIAQQFSRDWDKNANLGEPFEDGE